MQVYLVESNGVTDYGAAFRNFQDILPSLKISYSACHDVEIKLTPQIDGGPIYTVTGTRADKTAKFSETFKIHRLPVWDSPTHM